MSKQTVLLNLLACTPTRIQLLTLCEQWGVEPVIHQHLYIVSVDAHATIAILAQVALEDKINKED